MAKQIKDFLGLGKNLEIEDWKKEKRTYFLDDVVENNPTKIYPRCNYRNLEILKTHNVD